MTRVLGNANINAGSTISFTPAQLVATMLFVLATAAWGWRMDARSEAHEKMSTQLQVTMAKVETDLASVKTELMQLRKGGYTLTPTQTPVTETR